MPGFASAAVSGQITVPFRGAPQTVSYIRQVALQAQTQYPLRLLAEDIVGQLGSKDYLSEILAIYYWVCSHTRYANDPRTIELVRSPREGLSRLMGNVSRLRTQFGSQVISWKPSVDCDDLTALLAAIYLSIGREVRVVTVAFRNAFFAGKRQYSHVYLQVREPRTGQWIVVDPVAADTTSEMLSRVKAVRIWPVA